MNNSSINKIKIDLSRSHGSYIFDLNSNQEYLDFMGMYSTLAVGYNCEDVFSNIDENLLYNVFCNKITNCEIDSIILNDFVNLFHSTLDPNGLFPFSYFCSSGANAIEAALKVAYKSSKFSSPRVLTFRGSFHGIYGYGRTVTDRFDSTLNRLSFLEKESSFVCEPFYDSNSSWLNSRSLNDLVSEIDILASEESNMISAILVEPIQCTYGDHYLDVEFIRQLKRISVKCGIPLIFDEIQTGFYTTGKRWYYEHLQVIPDILVFGKKAQVSGIFVSKDYSEIFKIPGALEVTWDSNIVDMLRSTSIMKYIKSIDLESRILNYSKSFNNALSYHPNVIKSRSCGYLFCIDFENSLIRNDFYKQLKLAGMLCNPTREKSIRFRPNLLTTEFEFDHAIKLISKIKWIEI